MASLKRGCERKKSWRKEGKRKERRHRSLKGRETKKKKIGARGKNQKKRASIEVCKERKVKEGKK